MAAATAQVRERAVWLGHPARNAVGESVQRVPASPTVRRERVLSDDEIRRVWLATGPRAFNRIARTLLLTGQRRDAATLSLTGESHFCAKVAAIAPV
jgi:hypothetical protein